MRISNPNQRLDCSRLPWRFLLIACSYLLLLSSSVNSQDADSERNQNLEWQVLTKRNFSSQILLHQHVLLMVAVPWSGESRALMKELTQLAKLKKLDHLRLMVVYSNTEKTLAHSLGATTETAIFFYNNAIPYNYQGRLRAHHILSSVNYIVSLPSEELPLKLLNSSEDLTTFFNTTDKAVILFEFCGWTSRLLDQRNNESGASFNIGEGFDSGIISGSNHNGQGNVRLAPIREKNKGLIEEELTCGINNGPLGIPWLGEFTVANDSAYSETEDKLPQLGLSCTFEEFQRFESFFSNFTTSAREFFLPPERQRFGLVSERHLMTSLGVQDPDPWFVMLHFAGCPNCSRIFKDGDDIKSAFDMNHLLVAELGNVAHDVQSALPANKPSIILFVDRSSESPNTRRKSKAALEAFRELALHNQFLDQVATENRVTHRKVSAQPFQIVGDRRTSSRPDHSRRESLQLGQLKNDMSVVIINDGKAVSLDKISADAEGKSIQDIIAHLIQQQKGSKLSLLAKEAGFQLLSDDFEIKVRKLLPQVKELANSDNLFRKAPIENIVESEVNLENTNVPSDTSLFQAKLEDQTGAADLEFQFKEEKSNHNAKNTQISPVNYVMVEEGHVTEAEKSEEHEHNSREFRGLYFFSDGGYQLLKTLTAGSSIPSMVIVDPVSEQHYLCPEEAIFSYSSLQTFLDAFLNGSLIPYQRSEFVTQSLRKATQPPFINMDFHEVDSIPRVTAHTFSEQVLGYNESDVHVFSHSWKKDVLVLFSNSWCGFCQRMELVVHEVFQAFKGYINTSKSVTNKRESTFSSDVGDDMHVEVPLIFLMDCTLNDCSSRLKSMGERELYPALMLFPAQRKSAVPYRGDMSVNNVIDFLVHHGSNSHHLHGIKGAIWNAKQEGTNRVSVEDRLPSSVHEEDSVAKYHEVSLNYRGEPTRLTKTYRVKSHTSNNVIVGSVLISTDNLLNAPPFDKSIVLIVQANQSTGFLGLIVNKHISWDSFEGLQKGLEMVKQAPLSFGGPLISNGMPLVCLSRGVVREGYSEVFHGVYFMDQTIMVRELEAFKLGTQSFDDYWFFLGYSGWGWDQLFSEIAEGAWLVSDDPMAEFGWPGN